MALPVVYHRLTTVFPEIATRLPDVLLSKPQ